MDITETLAPKSDQQNYDDYIAGPRTVTVADGKVFKGSEQPLHIELVEYPGRPFKPNKSMRRVLAIAWGTETDAYIGRRLTLVGNPGVKYGGKAVGGIEIAAMSGIGKPLTLALTETRGKKRSFTVQPLPDAAPEQKQPDLTIPDDIKATTARMVSEGKLPDYLAWLTEQGAPTHITDYVQAQEPTE